VINRPGRSAIVAAALSIGISTLALPAFGKAQTKAVAPIAPTAQLSVPHLFARGNAALYNPDGIVVTSDYVFVVWQGQSDHLPGPSTIVKYDRRGHALGSLPLTGRVDGLRLNPYTNLIWAVLNNDGQNGSPKRQPLLYTINPNSLATKRYAFPAVQPHGGGYDDIAFVGGKAYLSAASPTLTATGVNDKPVVVSATLTAADTVAISPILYGTAVGYDENTGTFHRLNITDPDSLAVDATNDLVLVGDNDQEVIVIAHPGGGSSQSVRRYGFGTQFDDVAFTSGTSGTLWIADTTQNAVYVVWAAFPSGTAFAEGPAGIPVQSFIGTFAGTFATGGPVVTPLLTQRDGVYSPTALIFVPGT
jgi:hypothetical protein